jgi:hypothetical protein
MILPPQDPLRKDLPQDIVVAGSVTSLWASSRWSVTPLHYDPFDNTLVHLAGRKRVLLLPPREALRAYLHPSVHLRHRQSQVQCIKTVKIICTYLIEGCCIGGIVWLFR